MKGSKKHAHVLERKFADNFFELLKTECSRDVKITSKTQFTIQINDKEVIDFSVLEKREMLVVGLPFRVRSGNYKVVQYMDYFKIGNKSTESMLALINNVCHAYLTGCYSGIRDLLGVKDGI